MYNLSEPLNISVRNNKNCFTDIRKTFVDGNYMEIKDFAHSKIKKIFIELHGYSFFHSPSHLADIDERFIGREKIINKLESLLTNSESKSGAYLITGYRGMGKSSFVAKTLNRINSYHTLSKKSSRYLRIFFPLLLMSMIEVFPNFNSPHYSEARAIFLLFIPVACFLLSLSYLIKTDLTLNDIHGKNYSQKWSVHKYWIYPTLFGVAALFASFMNILNSPSIFTWLSLSFLIYTIAEIIKTLFEMPFLVTQDKNYYSLIKQGFKCFLNTFTIDREVVTKYRNRVMVQDFYLMSIIQIIGITLIYIVKNSIQDEITFQIRYLIYFCVYGLLICYNLVVAYNKKYIKDERSKNPVNKKDDSETKKKKPLPRYFENIKERIKSYVNYSNQVHIQINLGYENLKEIDILRLVAKGILVNYEKKIKTFAFPELPWRFGKFIIILFILGTTYYFNPIYKINQEIKRDINIVYWFPTQSKYIFNSENNYLKAYLSQISSTDKSQFNVRSYLNDLKYAPKIKSTDSIYFQYDESKQIVNTIRYVTIYLDLFIWIIYDKIIQNLPFSIKTIWPSQFNEVKTYTYHNVSTDFTIIPDELDYLFIMYFVFIWVSIRYLSSFRILGIVTHGYIIRRLNQLIEIIESQVALEHSISLNSKVNVDAKIKKSRFFTKADEREIESQLLEILAEVSRIPRFTRRPEFILIFDELDKIEPHKNLQYFEKFENDIENDKHEKKSSKDVIRLRQHNILKILANLKNFITTAKAKFIFVAGREMYDAALADVADRDFFIGSIFNEIIYVESFLKDKNDLRNSDITGLTETYVCKHLFPSNYLECRQYNLKYYNEYLKNKIFNNPNDPENDLKREKIIFTLSQFITYLTYRSNGAPKKITAYFEQYITSGNITEHKNETNNLSVVTRSSNLVLAFDFYAQYTFGLTTYLINPFFLSINKSIMDYGDKLLVSSSFLVDHLYKYHRTGFSWRNLELTPEIIDINKSPQLRELIVRIIRFLSQTHINVIDTGIYNFKFNRRISEEISFLSKINERESAAFNFTLDESLTIKRHYRRMLQDMEIVYKPYFSKVQNPDIIRSISFLHMILGELHFYDEEYDSAIIEYLEAVQLFGDDRFEKLSIELIIVMIRNTIKLGIAFEKKKTYDSAFMTYGKLASRIIKFRDVVKNNIDQEILDKHGNNLSIEDIISYVNDESKLTLLKERLFFRFSIIEGLRLIYQPFLAKFQILEKTTPLGIRNSDIVRLQKEFTFLIEDILPQGQKNYLIVPELKMKIGDILYYKNGTVSDDITKNNIHCQKSDSVFMENTHVEESVNKKGFMTPCRGCLFYMESLRSLCIGYLGIKKELFEANNPEDRQRRIKTMFQELLLFIDRQTLFNGSKNKSEPILKMAATLFSDIGDSFISCSSSMEQLSIPFLELYFKMINEGNYQEKSNKFNEYYSDNSKTITKIEEALIYYYLSAAFYRRARDYRECSHQYVKIMHIFKNYSKNKKINANNAILFDENIINQFKESVVKRSIRSLYRTYENSHRIEMQRYIDIFNIIDNGNINTVLFNQSISWDLREVILLFQEIKILNQQNSYEIALKIRKEMTVSSYTVVNSMYNRIQEMNFKELINDTIFKRIEYCVDENKNDLIIDSIFCLNEIIRISKIFGISFVINHYFIANCYKKLAVWCQRFYAIHDNDKADANTKLSRLMGANFNEFINFEYHREEALRHFRMSFETHREGKAYKEMIEDMVYLNDDLNENLVHFAVALERFNLINGSYFEMIDGLKKPNEIKNNNGISFIIDSNRSPDLYEVENYLK